MRIAFLLDHIPDISETFIEDMISELYNRSNEVLGIYKRVTPKQCHGKHSINKLYEKLFFWAGWSKKKTRRMHYIFYLLNNFNSIFQDRKKARRDKYLTVKFPLFSKDNITYHILCKHRPDIFFAHYGPVGQYFVSLKKYFNVPLVTYFHGYDLQRYPLQNPGMYNQLFATTEMMITQSNYGKVRLIDLGCPSDKIRVVPYGTIPLNQPVERPFKEHKRERLIILSIARLTEKKGLEFGIRALAKVKKEKPKLDFEYRIVGEGQLREQLTNLINKLGLKDSVTLLGALPREETQKELHRSHIFLLPSVTSATGDTEGSPVSILEAQNHSLPIVSSYHAGIPEIVIDGETAFLCPEKDVDCLANKLQNLLENAKLRLEMGLAGWHHIKQNFNQHKLIDMLDENLRDIILQHKTSV